MVEAVDPQEGLERVDVIGALRVDAAVGAGVREGFLHGGVGPDHDVPVSRSSSTCEQGDEQGWQREEAGDIERVRDGQERHHHVHPGEGQLAWDMGFLLSAVL